MADSPSKRSEYFAAITDRVTHTTRPSHFALSHDYTVDVRDKPRAVNVFDKDSDKGRIRQNSSDQEKVPCCPSPKRDDGVLMPTESFDGSATTSTRKLLRTEDTSHYSTLNNPYIPYRQEVPQSNRPEVMQIFSEAMSRGMLITINLSQVGLTATHALLLKDAIMRNCSLSSLKLAYNNLGDDGAKIIASAIGSNTASTPLSEKYILRRRHPSLTTIDLGFNKIGDLGCIALANSAISFNGSLRTLCLSGNTIREKGTIMLAAAILNDCGVSCLHLTANRIGTNGAKAIADSIAQVETKIQSSIQITNGSKIRSEQPHACPVQELHLGGTDMGPAGCLSVFNMIETNHSLKVISLCSTNIDDQDLSLFSQSISRNKNVPLEIIQLSFNKVTCCGVESLMNAVWGSKTLQEIALDNNQIRDRGAQLIAVALTSMKLTALNLGFNKITVIGIQSIMKMLTAENTTLESFTLSGNGIDTTAAKVISCALAYNTSLQVFCLDNCHLEHEARRHITAGIISNKRLSLKIVTGFRLGVSIITLGFPKILETWSNDKVLKFIHFLWYHKRQTDPKERLDEPINKVGKAEPNFRISPADPANVISAAKAAIEKIDTESAKSFMATICRSSIKGSISFQGSCQIAQLSEGTSTGHVKVIYMDDNVNDDDGKKLTNVFENDAHSTTELFATDNLRVNPERRKRNIRLVHKHMASLNELKNLPFKESYLWEIHQYFFSPIQPIFSFKSEKGDRDTEDCSHKEQQLLPNANDHELTPIVKDDSMKVKKDKRSAQSEKESTKIKKVERSTLGRNISFRCLSDSMVPSIGMPVLSKTGNNSNNTSAPNFSHAQIKPSTTPESSTKRRTSPSTSSSKKEILNQHGCKRSRISKARIDYYPRIKERIEFLSSTSSQKEILYLMRQALFMEKIMLKDKNDKYKEYVGKEKENYQIFEDIEMIVLDLL